MTFTNPSDHDLKALLDRPLTIAVVICSPLPNRDSHRIAGRLLEFGYRMIPVNPRAAGDYIHGQFCYSQLTDIPEPVDMVDVFRRASHVEPIIDDAIAIQAKSIWLQLGIVHEGGAKRAQEAGLTVVMDRCTSQDYRRLIQAPKT